MGRNGAGSAQQILSNNKTTRVAKKTPTVKNNLMIDVEDRLVQYLSDPYAGRVHDTRICDDEN